MSRKLWWVDEGLWFVIWAGRHAMLGQLAMPWAGPTALSACFSLAVGSQDSLLEITFRSNVLPVLCDPSTPKPEDIHLPQLGHGSDFPGTLGSPIGRSDCLVKLECYRFLPNSMPAPQEQVLGSLELIKFRESGIASEYESNTDESEEHDSWSQEEPPHLLNIRPKQDLGDSLEDEIAV